MEQAETVVVGAGPAGLACAAALRNEGRQAIVLEKDEKVGSSWRQHYDRLHLHTGRNHSGLPGLPMPRSYPKYPSRNDVIAYLENYAARFGVVPRFGTRVTRIGKAREWIVETQVSTLAAQNVIIATGIAGWPHRGNWPGKGTFPGRIVHSGAYANPEPFKGARVLVVGFGNSGAEIALDLANAGVDVTVSVRSPAVVVPRDLFGISILTWAIWQSWMPYRLVDALNAPMLRLMVGNLEKLGLRRSAKGPLAQIIEDHKVPVLDVGTVDLIRHGKIAVLGGIDRSAEEHVEFDDGTIKPFDVVIEATGFRPDLHMLLPDHAGALDESGAPKICGADTGYPGLYFCGHIPAPTGQLREIGIEARRIAALIRSRLPAERTGSS